MDIKEYLSIRKDIDLFVIFFTSIVAAILLRTKFIIYSVALSHGVSLIFIFISYFSLMRIGKRMKEHEVHGISAIAWASMGLFSISNIFAYSNARLEMPWLLLLFISVVIYVKFAIDGMARLFMSIVYVSKKRNENSLIAVEGTIAMFTSIIALIITLVDIILLK